VKKCRVYRKQEEAKEERDRDRIVLKNEKGNLL
jgi:hypothetical protein